MQVLIVVLVHGLFGGAADWTLVQKKLKEKSCPENKKILILSSRRNQLQTHRGIERLGRNLWKELCDFFQQNSIDESQSDTTVFLTFVGHSLGGLIAERTMGILLESQRFQFLKPCSFITISTPHLGTWRTIKDIGFRQLSEHKVINFVCRNLLGRTGKELQMKDRQPSDKVEHEDKNSILWNLSKSKAIDTFPCRTAIGHHADQTVPLASALLLGPSYLRPSNSYEGVFDVKKFHVGYHSGFPSQDNDDGQFYQQLALPVIQHYRNQGASEDAGTSPPDSPAIQKDANNTIRYTKDLLKTRDKSWRQVSIDFACPGLWRYFSHELIIGKDHWFQPKYLRASASASANWIADLIVCDFLRVSLPK